MTPRERWLAWMRFEGADRPFLWEWEPWLSTVRRWQREALGSGGEPPQYDECDAREKFGVDLWHLPREEEHVIAEDERSVTVRTDRGTVKRELKDPDALSMPEFIDYPVKTRADWEAIRDRFDPADPGRFPADWHERCSRWKREEPVLLFMGVEAPSLFGMVRELMGAERTFYAFYDEPALVHDMMEVNTEFLVDLLPRVLADAPITAISFWEDMSCRHGPLISPAMFREFMLPRYRRITDVARAHGIDVICVDSDGDVTELIPLWLEAGINGVFPMEVAAGMDVVKLRREYGRDLVMTGGIDKRVLAKDKAAIDDELRRTLPLVEQGGYIAHLDHAVPHDVPYDNFAYYWQRKKELLGIA